MNKNYFLIYCFISSFLILNTLHFNVLAAEGPVSREQIEERYQWNLGDIYSDPKEWEVAFSKIQNEYLPR